MRIIRWRMVREEEDRTVRLECRTYEIMTCFSLKQTIFRYIAMLVGSIMPPSVLVAE